MPETKEIEETFGAYLRGLRKSRQLTLREVEEKIVEMFPQSKPAHVSHTYIIQLEKDKLLPSPSKLKSLATVYKENYELMLFKAGYSDHNPFKKIEEEWDAEKVWEYCLYSIVKAKKTRPLTVDEKRLIRQMVENMIVSLTEGR